MRQGELESTVAARNHRPRRLTQLERSALTRDALLNSTLACLAELGYDGATTTEISERAGLSRGAHLHHFRTRSALLAAAAGTLADNVLSDLEAGLAGLPSGPERIGNALDMLWGLFTGPFFQAVLELAVHARTDPELRGDLDPIEQVAGRGALPLIRHAFGRETSDHSFDDAIVLAMAAIRGLAIMGVIEPDYDPTWRWKRCRQTLVEMLERESSPGARPT